MEMLFEEEQRQIQTISDRLQRDSNAIAVLVINKDGQEIARSGQTADLDVTSLSSLFAGNVAATGEIAKLLKEEEFGGQFHEGTKQSVNISVVARRAILVVLFDSRSSLGLVRMRVRRATEEMTNIFEALVKKIQQQQASGSVAGGGFGPNLAGEITDDDIDKLFGE
jgi:predicted regulator of Ras-like GTPase activity (Roadblock/LC7/MglB family)